MYELIDKNISKHIDLAKEELDLFHSMLTVKKFKKKEFLLQQGEVCHFTGFITKGCIKNYVLDEKGNEFILYFAIEDWWVGDISSFFEQIPGTLFIQTVEDTELLMLDYRKSEQLFKEIPKFDATSVFLSNVL